MFQIAVTAVYLLFVVHFIFQPVKIQKISKGAINHKMIAADKLKEIKTRQAYIFFSMMIVSIIIFIMFFFQYG